MIYRSVAGTPLGGAGHLGLMMQGRSGVEVTYRKLPFETDTCENDATIYNVETHSAGMNE